MVYPTNPVQNTANQIPLFRELNQALKQITNHLIDTDNRIDDNPYNRIGFFSDDYNQLIKVKPLEIIKALGDSEYYENERDINCKYTSRTLLKETNKALIDKTTENPYNESDYRYKLFKNHPDKVKEFIIDIVKENFKFDATLYSSRYPIGHPKWESKENKACNVLVNPSSISLTAIPLKSPFIRLNSKNKFNNFVVDIDFPELKGNKEALLKKYYAINNLFNLLKRKGFTIFVPNFITFTSKGFQLGYVFEATIYHKFKKEKLAMIHYKKETGNFISPNSCEPVKRETAFKLEKFFNNTIGTLTKVLAYLFNGDKYAIQTYTQGRVIRNPLVNASLFFSLEKKDLFEMRKLLPKFAEAYLNIVKEVNPFDFTKAPKLEEVKKIQNKKVFSTTLTKQDLKAHPFTITVNKKEFIEENYEFKNEEEEEIVIDAFITDKLPVINFAKTEGEGFRNVFLFTYGRFFAYELKKKNPDISEEELYNKLSILLGFINRNFMNSLDLEEVEVIINSIIKFIQKKFNPNINVKFNRKLAQWKHYKTKVQFSIDLLNKVFITTKHLKEMTTKDIAKLTKVSYKTLLRWVKEDKEALIKAFKEAIKMINVKNEEDALKVNIKNFFSEFKLRTITTDKKKINLFYSSMRNYTTLFIGLKSMVKDDFYTFMQMTMLNL